MPMEYAVAGWTDVIITLHKLNVCVCARVRVYTQTNISFVQSYNYISPASDNIFHCQSQRVFYSKISNYMTNNIVTGNK